MFRKLLEWLDDHPRRRLVWAWILTLLAVTIAGVFAMRCAHGAEASLTWVNPTQRVDGTPFATSEIRDYQIDFAKCTAGSTFPITADGTATVTGPATAAKVTVNGYGLWCFRMRVSDLGGQYSANTGTVSRQYVAPPNPPTLVTVAGIVWELKTRPDGERYLSRVVGTVEAGEPCYGLAPQAGFDLFRVARDSVHLTRGVGPQAELVAQCAIG